ncbi:uncharacterized protein LOC109803640 [Cajanus cajan]|nr:uncharacterized protein LOC109803640 [Cajanus cajan]
MNSFRPMRELDRVGPKRKSTKKRSGTTVPCYPQQKSSMAVAVRAFHQLHSQSHSHSHFPSIPPHSLRLTLNASPLFKPRPLTSVGISLLPERRCMPVPGVVEESQESSEPEPEPEPEPEVKTKAELASELKKAMEERKDNLLSGVAREIDEIEWPAFGKVLGTTGVVLAVIFGSSVVLLTVNAVLAELSDQVFAGKGIQDFFT